MNYCKHCCLVYHLDQNPLWVFVVFSDCAFKKTKMYLFNCSNDYPVNVQEAAKGLCNLALAGTITEEEARMLHVVLEDFKQGIIGPVEASRNG